MEPLVFALIGAFCVALGLALPHRVPHIIACVAFGVAAVLALV